MTDRPTASDSPEEAARLAIEQSAADWDVRLRSPHCTDEDRAAFEAWEAADPRHCAAFEKLQLTLDIMRGLGERPQIRALREEATAGLQRSTVRRRRFGLATGAAIAMAAGLIAAVSLDLSLLDQNGNVYQTALNERTVVTLADGSTVSLNSNSRLESDFTADRRSLRLTAGQALFNVAKDPSRPFVVHAAGQQIVAIGTSFDVRVDPGKMRVTLIEGKVTVRRDTPQADVPAQEQHLLPKQQLILPTAADSEKIAVTKASPSEPVIRQVDPEKVISWTDGRVFFDDTPLSEAVAEMNRYSETKLVVADPRLNRFRINGMFRTGSQTSFVGALEAYFPIEARTDEEKRILLSGRVTRP